MALDKPQRRLAAILAADVAGYSRLMGEDEEGTLVTLTAHITELIEPCIAEHRGRVVKTTGDGLLAEFASVVDAVRCAVAFQEGMGERNSDTPEDRRIAFRIGVNLGDVIVQDDDVYGDGVNVAARLEGLADAGGVVVSGTVHEHVRGKLDIQFDDLGSQEVKNIAEPVRAFRVASGASPASAARRADGALPLPDKPSIVVLPFQNMSGDPDQEYFSDGISEDIITALSRIRWFFVTARNSSFSYKGQSLDVRQVANDLGVRYVLEGSVRKSANRVRVTAQLVDGRTGNHIWADRYDRELADIFALQDEITQVVVGTIEPEMARAEQERASIKPPENLDAWEAYQRGLWHAQLHQDDELPAAERLFRRAIELDPNLSSAYSALSEALGRQALASSDAPEQALSETVSTARKAVRLDASDAAARCALGRAYFFSREPDKAIIELRKAIELNPSYAHAHFSIGATLVLGSGQPAEAIPHLEMARRLSPRDYLYGAMMARQAEACLLMKQYAEAVAWGKQAVSEDRSWLNNYYGYVSALGYLEDLDEAREVIVEMRAINEDVSINIFRRRFQVMKEPDMEYLLAGLRKAGLPEQ